MSDAVEEWEFELGETVTLLWMLEGVGAVIGRSETTYQDDQFEVEYPDLNGKLTRTWVTGDAIDHLGRVN